MRRSKYAGGEEVLDPGLGACSEGVGGGGGVLDWV